MQINGTPGDDNLIGTDGDDVIHPGQGDDTIAAGKGNDYIFAGGSGDGGSDTIDAGEGHDVVSYDFGGDSDGVTFTSSGHGPGTRSQVDPLGGVDSLTNVEQVDIFGGSGNDTLTGDAGSNGIVGNGGDDTLVGGGGDDWLQGGAGNDILDGGANGQHVDSVDYSSSTAGVIVNLATGIASDGLGGTDTLIGIEGINGSAFDDVLVGDGNSNWFRPGAGNDSVEGGAGTDVVFYEQSLAGVDVNLQTGVATGADIGTDSLSSIEGLHGSFHHDQLTLSDAGGYVFGRAGNDLLDGGAGNDHFIGGSGNDEIHGGAGQDSLSYTDDSFDSANGLPASTGAGVTVNLSTGTATDNWGDTDTFDGIEGVTGSGLNDTITGDAANNFLDGASGDDVLLGMGGSDFMLGGQGNDTLEGQGDNDSLDGGQGDDLLDGGAGDFDQAVYFSATGSVTVDLAMGSSSGAAGHDTLLNIENASGSQFADVLIGNTGRNFLQGYGGDDMLHGGGGDDFLEGGTGNDHIDGGAGAGDVAGYFDSSTGVGVNLATNVNTGGAAGDTLINVEGVSGSAFDDTLTGNTQSNFLDGGSGNDQLFGLDGNDNLAGGLGDDVLHGGNGSDNVGYFAAAGAVQVNLTTGLATGADGNDTLVSIENIAGSFFDDQLTGSASGNFIDGGNGNDQIFGLDGNDNLAGGLGDDALDGGNGIDNVSYFAAAGAVQVNLSSGLATGADGNDTLASIENIAGSAFDDQLTGSAAGNFIDGGNGNDQILGLDGNDNLSGGLGNDLLDGGNGGDSAIYSGSSGGVVVNLTTGTATGSAGNDTLVGIENVIGSDFDDSITGDGNVNFIDGRGGNDTMLGGAGRDNFLGGAGNDSFDGGAILDRANYTDLNSISYQNSTAAIHLNLQTGIVQDGLGGTDTLANINFVTGSQLNDTLVGSNAVDLFEQFDGGAGNDTIDGGAIDQVLQRNSNRVTYANASGAVTVNLAAGTATGAAGDDTLLNINHATGSNQSDTLIGSDSAITEQFDGRSGNDHIDGAGGIDIVRYDSATTGVEVNLVTGEGKDGHGTIDTLRNIEGIRGSNFDDKLTGGNTLNTVIEIFTGNAGNDLIDGGIGYDRADYLTATSGVVVTLGGTATGSAQDGLGGLDTLISIEAVRGSAFDDVLSGSDSAAFESFEGREGNDLIDGKGGVDRADYQFAVGGVTVNLKSGTALDGSGGTDTLRNIENARGSSFNDMLTGGKGSNTLEGGAGNDRIFGGSGVDTAVFSGTQASYAIVKHGNKVTVTGADGIDVLKSIEVLEFSDGSLVIKGKGSHGRNERASDDDEVDDGDWTDCNGLESWRAQDGGRHEQSPIWAGHGGGGGDDGDSVPPHGHGSDWTYGA